MNNLGRRIFSLKLGPIVALFGLLVARDPAFGQSSDSLKYFPCDSGDTWFYYGEDGYSTIKVESVFSDPKGKLVYMTNRDTTYLYVDTTKYLVDTATGIVYTVFPPPDSLRETYRFDAQRGDCWAYDSSTYLWNGVGLGTGDSVAVFGVPTRIKSFEYFLFDASESPPNDPRVWNSYMTRYYAYRFGMIEEGLEGGGGRVLIGAILNGDSMGTILDVKKKKNDVPEALTLFQNYPNPFNPSTVISYQLSAVSHVTLKFYDVLGRELRTLVNEVKTPGRYEIEFDGSNFPSGVYFYRMIATTRDGMTFIQVKKLTLIK